MNHVNALQSEKIKKYMYIFTFLLNTMSFPISKYKNLSQKDKKFTSNLGI